MAHNLVFVRPAKPGEGQMFSDWSKENPVNGFDPKAALHPSTFTLCAYDKDGPLAFQPVQQVFMMESFAPRPGSTKHQNAVALKEIFQETVTQAHIKGVGEIYYMSTDPGTDNMTTNQEVFEELPYKVFRVKLASLEG